MHPRLRGGLGRLFFLSKREIRILPRCHYTPRSPQTTKHSKGSPAGTRTGTANPHSSLGSSAPRGAAPPHKGTRRRTEPASPSLAPHPALVPQRPGGRLIQECRGGAEPRPGAGPHSPGEAGGRCALVPPWPPSAAPQRGISGYLFLTQHRARALAWPAAASPAVAAAAAAATTARARRRGAPPSRVCPPRGGSPREPPGGTAAARRHGNRAAAAPPPPPRWGRRAHLHAASWLAEAPPRHRGPRRFRGRCRPPRQRRVQPNCGSRRRAALPPPGTSLGVPAKGAPNRVLPAPGRGVPS